MGNINLNYGGRRICSCVHLFFKLVLEKSRVMSLALLFWNICLLHPRPLIHILGAKANMVIITGKRFLQNLLVIMMTLCCMSLRFFRILLTSDCWPLHLLYTYDFPIRIVMNQKHTIGFFCRVVRSAWKTLSESLILSDCHCTWSLLPHRLHDLNLKSCVSLQERITSTKEGSLTSMIISRNLMIWIEHKAFPIIYL